MTKVKGIHRDIRVATGDWIRIEGGAEGQVTAVNLKWTMDGIYGNRASYRIRTSPVSHAWIRDDQVRACLRTS